MLRRGGSSVKILNAGICAAFPVRCAFPSLSRQAFVEMSRFFHNDFSDTAGTRTPAARSRIASRWCIAAGVTWAVLGFAVPALAQNPPDDGASGAAEGRITRDAESNAPRETTDEARGKRDVRVYLMEGSIVSGNLSVEVLTVKTAFGTLEIPVEHVVSFTPGLESHPQLRDRIGRLIQQLGSNDAAERDQAQRELTDFGPGIRTLLERYRKDPDAERRTRIEKILEEVELQASDDPFLDEPRPSLILEDTIETDRFTIVGQIAPESFRVETPFGPLTVALKDIRYVARESDEKPEVRARASVDASHLPQVGLKDTGIRLKRGDRVSVTAKGSIIMTPWGNNVSSTPDGAGMNVPTYAAGIPSGALIGRIGRSGEEFLVGARNEFTAKTTGTLYLGVAMAHQFANQGYTFPGSYDVRLRVNPSED